MADQAAPRRGPRTIVVGLGNPVLGDDGVGWRVADEVEGRLHAARECRTKIPDVEIERLGVGGLRLMECLTGYEAAILVDAAEFPGPAGRRGSFLLLRGARRPRGRPPRFRTRRVAADRPRPWAAGWAPTCPRASTRSRSRPTEPTSSARS